MSPTNNYTHTMFHDILNKYGINDFKMVQGQISKVKSKSIY